MKGMKGISMKQVENDCKDWVIKNNENHYVHRNSVRRSGNDTWLYISYQTFAPECRWFTTQTEAERALEEIITKSEKANIDTTFHLERHNVEELIRQHKESNSESMIIRECPSIKKSLKQTGK